jgi:hypothetical protein
MRREKSEIPSVSATEFNKLRTYPRVLENELGEVTRPGDIRINFTRIKVIPVAY